MTTEFCYMYDIFLTSCGASEINNMCIACKKPTKLMPTIEVTVSEQVSENARMVEAEPVKTKRKWPVPPIHIYCGYSLNPTEQEQAEDRLRRHSHSHSQFQNKLPEKPE